MSEQKSMKASIWISSRILEEYRARVEWNRIAKGKMQLIKVEEIQRTRSDLR